MLVIFLLGFILDFIEITFMVVPLVGPVLLAMGLDPVWLVWCNQSADVIFDAAVQFLAFTCAAWLLQRSTLLRSTAASRCSPADASDTAGISARPGNLAAGTA